MKRAFFWIVVLAVALAAGVYFWPSLPRQGREPAPEAVTRPVPETPPAAPLHPVSEPAVEPAETESPIDLDRPLPALAEADMPMVELLAELFPGVDLGRFFILENVIERFVVMVDNLPRRQLPRRQMPLRTVAGRFQATGEGDYLVIDPANYRRYRPYVRLAETLDPRLAVAVYVHYYPLFQQAYRELGYPHGYFNDRLIEVIDHLLAAPKVDDPIHLVQPGVVYRFADPALEDLSAGQKILLRSGPVNAERLKGVLRELRRELVGRTNEE